jgi:hypothetical protein
MSFETQILVSLYQHSVNKLKTFINSKNIIKVIIICKFSLKNNIV